MSAADEAFAMGGDPMDDVVQHLDHGWIYSSPESFGLARIIDVKWPDEDLMCPDIYYDPSDCLTDPDLGWYFTRVAGDVAEVLSRLPFPLPWVAWHRTKMGVTSVRRYRYDRLVKLYCRQKSRQCGFHSIQRGREATKATSSATRGTTSESTGQ